MRTDQVTPALIEGTRQRRRGRNMMEAMSKRNYVIGAREPIGGDRSPRRYRNGSDEYPLPVVKRNGMGRSSGKERSVAERKEAIVTDDIISGNQPKDNNLLRNAPRPLSAIVLSDKEWNWCVRSLYHDW